MNPDDHDISILVVDDEEIVVSLVKDALEDEGYETLTAPDGQSAVEILKRRPVSLVITDIRMSPMDGIELAQQARNLYPDIVIIFMTGYANLNTAKEAIKYGAFDYIMKPFELNEIRQSVQKGVDKIKKDNAEKSSADQLERLSDLSQMLYEVGDPKSLVAISLKYAIMQLNGIAGNVLYWATDRQLVRLLHGNQDGNFESSLSLEQSKTLFETVDFGSWKEAQNIEHFSHHPLSSFAEKANILDELFPEQYRRSNVQLVSIPISRAESVFGVLTVAFDAEKTSLKQPDLRLLAITTSQLALSLENLFLLDETQIAYSHLKQLQDETIQLEKMATRGEISAEIGHELNNFLGVVAGNLQLLELQWNKEKYDQLGKYIEVMNRNIEKMKDFTSNLMDLRRISSKKETLFFDRLLTEVLDYLKPQKRYDGVSIVLNQLPENIVFEADSTHIQQLLYNLMNNAADATDNCELRQINVAVEVEAEKEIFRLVISDTGSGIEEELLQKAFKEKFTTKPDGHGFGLLVCNRIIESHNGTLSVKSQAGEGTTIKIEFPMAACGKPVPVS